MYHIEINIAKDFSETPGPRDRNEGEFSGEEFYEVILKPKYIEAKEKNVKLKIILDGTYGYGTSFLERSFGELAREYGEDVLDRLEFVSEEEPYLIDEIIEYMKEAIKQNNENEKI